MSLETATNNHKAAEFVPGDLVEVRAWPEIAATLDQKGALENLPFMPEMLAFCGRQFRVSRRAFKTCIDDRDMRALKDTVLLEEVRCSGKNHGACDRACLIFWKEGWLKPAGMASHGSGSLKSALTESDLHKLAHQDDEFVCQSSEIVTASTPLPWWQGRQYVWDLTRNRMAIFDWLRSLSIAAYNKIAHLASLSGWRAVAGNGAESSKSTEPLNLRPGELVRVKPLSAISITLDGSGKHQNLLFAPTMIQFCGQVMRVRNRVENIILEGTRRQRKLKDTVILENAVCDGICHRMCPRQSFLFWRECWLERVNNK
jgi:hypothetical protein